MTLRLHDQVRVTSGPGDVGRSGTVSSFPPNRRYVGVWFAGVGERFFLVEELVAVAGVE